MEDSVFHFTVTGMATSSMRVLHIQVLSVHNTKAYCGLLTWMDKSFSH